MCWKKAKYGALFKNKEFIHSMILLTREKKQGLCRGSSLINWKTPKLLDIVTKTGKIICFAHSIVEYLLCLSTPSLYTTTRWIRSRTLSSFHLKNLINFVNGPLICPKNLDVSAIGKTYHNLARLHTYLLISTKYNEFSQWLSWMFPRTSRQLWMNWTTSLNWQFTKWWLTMIKTGWT